MSEDEAIGHFSPPVGSPEGRSRSHFLNSVLSLLLRAMGSLPDGTSYRSRYSVFPGPGATVVQAFHGELLAPHHVCRMEGDWR